MSTSEQSETPQHRGFSPALVVIPLVLFIALAVLFYFRLYAGNPNIVPSVLIGKPVPEFALPPLENRGGVDQDIPGLSTADLRGEVTVVNVWASWCGPCREEAPYLMALSQSGVRVAGINHKDRPENARRFLAQFGNPFSNIGADRNGRVSIDWGVYGVPETFIVDAHGIIIHKHIGPFNQTHVRETFLPIIEAARTGGETAQ